MIAPGVRIPIRILWSKLRLVYPKTIDFSPPQRSMFGHDSTIDLGTPLATGPADTFRRRLHRTVDHSTSIRPAHPRAPGRDAPLPTPEHHPVGVVNIDDTPASIADSHTRSPRTPVPRLRPPPGTLPRPGCAAARSRQVVDRRKRFNKDAETQDRESGPSKSSGTDPPFIGTRRTYFSRAVYASLTVLDLHRTFLPPPFRQSRRQLARVRTGGPYAIDQPAHQPSRRLAAEHPEFLV
jgi:hypothetical protein